MTMIGSNITIFDMVSNMGKFVDNNFLSRTQLVAIDLLQDASTRRSLSTAYRIRSEVT